MRHILIRVLSLFILAMLVIGFAGMQDRVGHADVGVVLATTVRRTGQPSARLAARLRKTVQLYRAGYFPIIIASGGMGIEGFKEADAMKIFLVKAGVPASRIWLDTQGINTYQTAKNVSALMRQHHFQSVFVVTQFFHIPRTYLSFLMFGIHDVYHAHADFYEPRDVYSLAREVIGLCVYTERWVVRYLNR